MLVGVCPGEADLEALQRSMPGAPGDPSQTRMSMADGLFDGGRLHTVDLDGWPVDLGGSWIHTPIGNPLRRLADQAGVPCHGADPLPEAVAYDCGEGRRLTPDELAACLDLQFEARYWWRRLSTAPPTTSEERARLSPPATCSAQSARRSVHRARSHLGGCFVLGGRSVQRGRLLPHPAGSDPSRRRSPRRACRRPAAVRRRAHAEQQAGLRRRCNGQRSGKQSGCSARPAFSSGRLSLTGSVCASRSGSCPCFGCS